MKHLLVLLLVLMFVLSLSGCIYYKVEKNYEVLYDISEIEAINIYQKKNDYAGFSVDTPIIKLDTTQYSQFIEDLESLPFTKGVLLVIAAVDPSFETGEYIVEIVYKNGGFEFISNKGYQEQKAADSRVKGIHYNCEEEVWSAFVQKYIAQPSLQLHTDTGPYWFRRG